MTRPSPQERCTRWLLLLVLLHTVPVVWITPVAAGTAPTAALLAFGFANLFTFDREGAALGVLVLVPTLVYCALGWGVAWVLARLLQRLRRPARAVVLAVLTVVLLASVYSPIYIAGSHNASRSANLVELLDNTLDPRVLLGYWIALHLVSTGLFIGHLLDDAHPAMRWVERWRRPALVGGAMALVGALLYGHYPLLLCRPLAALGSTRAELCLARVGGAEQRDWYERAAEGGEIDAIRWMRDHATTGEMRRYWLRKAAEQGDAASQFALYHQLARTGDLSADGEAAQWLHRAAEADYIPAQLALVEQLSRDIYRTQSRELLPERNAWLERAARLGARDARLRLAQHHVDGSMGYPVDLDLAQTYYRELAKGDELTDYERAAGLGAAHYRTQVDELDALQTGLARGDPAVIRTLAERYLASQLPGPGVREQGLAFMERLATEGDAAARDALILSLRTGSGGVDKDVAAARDWLLKAAEAGDPQAMSRVADNYMSGREGFPIDYPLARHWIEARIAVAAQHDTDDARSQLRQLRKDLAHIDRLSEQAGGTLLGEHELERLGERSDAESSYRYALQLLAGHGPDRRAEAIARLEQAARDGHGDAAWRLVEIHEHGFPAEIDPSAALEYLQLAAARHHFLATRELALSYEQGKRGLPVDLPRAIQLYEAALAAGRDNRYGWNLDPDNFNHFAWLESRLKQARLKLDALTGQ